jgi:hypothetical protein
MYRKKNPVVEFMQLTFTFLVMLAIVGILGVGIAWLIATFGV